MHDVTGPSLSPVSWQVVLAELLGCPRFPALLVPLQLLFGEMALGFVYSQVPQCPIIVVGKDPESFFLSFVIKRSIYFGRIRHTVSNLLTSHACRIRCLIDSPGVIPH